VAKRVTAPKGEPNNERLEQGQDLANAGGPPTLGLDDGLEPAEPNQAGGVLEPPPAPVIQGKPYCEKHNVLMVSYATRGAVTHYRCPVAGCSSKGKAARPSQKVPSKPQLCPQKTCRDREGKPAVALEVVPRLSNLAQLHMACPQCGFHVKAPRPQFDEAAQQRLRRQKLSAAEDLSSR
jgi:hypothetical protein